MTVVKQVLSGEKLPRSLILGRFQGFRTKATVKAELDRACGARAGGVHRQRESRFAGAVEFLQQDLGEGWCAHCRNVRRPHAQGDG